jgi:hypothetical protein
MTHEFGANDSHISIAMPDGTTCRAYLPFQVYSTDDGGEIVRMDYSAFVPLAVMVATQQARSRQILTDLPHSPERTAMRSIE